MMGKKRKVAIRLSLSIISLNPYQANTYFFKQAEHSATLINIRKTCQFSPQACHCLLSQNTFGSWCLSFSIVLCKASCYSRNIILLAVLQVHINMDLLHPTSLTRLSSTACSSRIFFKLQTPEQQQMDSYQSFISARQLVDGRV